MEPSDHFVPTLRRAEDVGFEPNEPFEVGDRRLCAANVLRGDRRRELLLENADHGQRLRHRRREVVVRLALCGGTDLAEPHVPRIEALVPSRSRVVDPAGSRYMLDTLALRIRREHRLALRRGYPVRHALKSTSTARNGKAGAVASRCTRVRSAIDCAEERLTAPATCTARTARRCVARSSIGVPRDHRLRFVRFRNKSRTCLGRERAPC